MKNIVLTGFMGTGKTEVGKLLAKKLSYTFVDADTEIELQEKMPITEIFKRFGEPYFRDVESEVIKRLSKMERVVISTGGGAVLRNENVANLKRNGILICLQARPETIYERTKHDTSRPLLQVEDPLQRIKELLEIRRPYYEKADIMIETDNKTPEEVAQEIIDKVSKTIR